MRTKTGNAPLFTTPILPRCSTGANGTRRVESACCTITRCTNSRSGSAASHVHDERQSVPAEIHVSRCAELLIPGEPFAESPLLAAARIALEVVPVVEQQQRSVLQIAGDEVQHV